MVSVGSGAQGFAAGGGLAVLTAGAVITWRPPKLRLGVVGVRIRDHDRRRRSGVGVFGFKVEGLARKNFQIRKVHLTFGLARWVASAGNRTFNLLKNKTFRGHKNRSFSPVKASRTSFARLLRIKIFSSNRAQLKKCSRGGTLQTRRPTPIVYPSVRGLGQILKSVSWCQNFLRKMGLGVGEIRPCH